MRYKMEVTVSNSQAMNPPQTSLQREGVIPTIPTGKGNAPVLWSILVHVGFRIFIWDHILIKHYQGQEGITHQEVMYTKHNNKTIKQLLNHINIFHRCGLYPKGISLE